jgi:hypothetical protein
LIIYYYIDSVDNNVFRVDDGEFEFSEYTADETDADTSGIFGNWDFSEIADNDATATETAPDVVRANPADLLNLIKLTHGISDRGMISCLELMKLQLDVSGVRQIDITKPEEVVCDIAEEHRCRTCSLNISDTFNCPSKW